MVTRIFSAIVIIMLIAPVVIIGGTLFQLAVYLLALMALKEFIGIKETKKEMPLFVKFISYIMMTLFIFSLDYTAPTMALDLRLLSGIFLVYLIPVIIYNNRKLYSINDAFYLIGGLFFLGYAFSLLILIRNLSIDYLLFLLIITVIGDTHAYITGVLVGKTKLLADISPKKTFEGAIGGLIMAVIVSTAFYLTVINPDFDITILIMITIFLSILSQFGDLVFSSIKRYFGKKDYSDLIPGHGGILDRVDSLVFVLMGFVFFLAIL